MTSALPPAATILSAAPALNLCAWMVRARSRSPSPSTLMPSKLPLIRPARRIAASSTTSPAAKRTKSLTLTVAQRVRNRFLKPNFGRRRCSGIWPPSKWAPTLPLLRARWPLWPRPAVLPRPVPVPRPRRFLFRVAPSGGRSELSSFITFSGARRKRRALVPNRNLAESLVVAALFGAKGAASRGRSTPFRAEGARCYAHRPRLASTNFDNSRSSRDLSPGSPRPPCHDAQRRSPRCGAA